MIKFLESKLGSLERIPLPQLILEIKYNVVKWSDTNKQVHMMEAMQNQNEPFVAVVLRLRQLATNSNLFSRCGDGYCRSWFLQHMLMLAMMRGLCDQRIRNELLYHLTDMDLDDASPQVQNHPREDRHPSLLANHRPRIFQEGDTQPSENMKLENSCPKSHMTKKGGVST